MQHVPRGLFRRASRILGISDNHSTKQPINYKDILRNDTINQNE